MYSRLRGVDFYVDCVIYVLDGYDFKTQTKVLVVDEAAGNTNIDDIVQTESQGIRTERNMIQPDLTTVCTTTAILLACCYFFLQHRRNENHRKLPPCPVRPWPVVGNIFSIGEDIRARFKAWHKQCGGVFSIYFGSTLVVVVSGFRTIKEVFVHKGSVTSNRPEMFMNEVKMLENASVMKNPRFRKETVASLMRVAESSSRSNAAINFLPAFLK
ncbi:hypothetical protein RRG08_064910 [Elysia crispata]|uniref:Cytochrome P450 n=1 Tax=Elysia crispata TaxID=231223 RepID=A0AAE1CLE7_9GAST|nr:hypothetical protein RRG08_064910 [Elysia crispata]